MGFVGRFNWQIGAGAYDSLYVKKQLLLAPGSAAAPAYSFYGDPNTGFVGLGPDSLGIVTGGTNNVKFGAGGFPLTVMGGNVGIGTTVPGNNLEIAQNAGESNVEISTWSTTDSHKSTLIFQKSSSATVNTLAVTADNENLGRILFNGVNSGSAATIAGLIDVEQDGAATASYVPGALVFWTADATVGVTERMRIDKSGFVGIGTPGPTSLFHAATTTANNTSPLAYIHAAATAGTDNQPVLKVHQDYAASTGQGVIFITNDSDSNSIYDDNGARLTAAGVWTNASSLRYKMGVENFDGEKALRDLQSHRIVTFQYKKGPPVRYIGMIAEEWKDVGVSTDGAGIDGVSASAYSLAALKALAEKVDKLEKRISYGGR